MNQKSHTGSCSDKRILVMIGVIAIMIRGMVCFWNLDRFSGDPDAYRAIAETISQSGVLGLTDGNGEPRPSAFRPPLYPFFLSWTCEQGELLNYRIGILHTLLGAFTVVLVFLTARRVIPSDSPWPSLAAAMLVLIDPILLQQSTMVMTETLAVALTVLAVWIWVAQSRSGFRWWHSVAMGVTLSLAFLCRPTFLVWAVLLVAAMVWWNTSAKQTWASRVASSGIVSLIMIFTVGTWTFRNQVVLGHPIWATTHGGYTLLLGNNPSFYRYLSEGQFGTAWDAEPFFDAYQHRYEGDATQASFWNQDWSGIEPTYQPVTEKEDDQVAYEAAVATIRRQPSTFIWSCFVRVGRLWTPLPHQTESRSWASVLPIAGYYGVFYAAIVVALIRYRARWMSKQSWAIVAMIVTLTGVHAIYWSNLRMRAPSIPGLAVVAASALVRRGGSQDQNSPEI